MCSSDSELMLVSFSAEEFQKRRGNNSIKSQLVQAVKNAENASEVSPTDVLTCSGVVTTCINGMSRTWLQILLLESLISPWMTLRTSSLKCVVRTG